MAKIVGVFATGHAPNLVTTWERAGEDVCKRTLAAMEEVGKRIREARATALITISNDHFNNFFLNNLPAGVRLHQHGFSTCSEEVLRDLGPRACRASSVASPLGSVLGEVTFGAERVPEEAGLRAFFAPRGGLLFYTAGRSPVLVEIVSSGHFVPAHKRPYGLELITAVPPVATVPGAPLASVKRIKIKVGAAIRKGRRVISYGYMPRSCPRGGFPVRTEIVFGGSFGPGREFGLPAFTAAATYRAPCPRRRR